MPPRLTKPANVLRARQPLIGMLWRFFYAAGRPSLRRIADAILELPDEDRRGTANPETIRRTMHGKAVGQWETIEVIFLALCELADVDPHDLEGGSGGPELSHLDRLRGHWNLAIDGEGMPARPRTRAERAAEQAAEAERAKVLQDLQDNDPWASPAPF